VGQRYITTMYYAVLMLSGNEIGPRTDWEIIIVFSLLVICMVIGSIFVGEFSNLVTSSSEKETFL
jgi:hypothetical protein